MIVSLNQCSWFQVSVGGCDLRQILREILHARVRLRSNGSSREDTRNVPPPPNVCRFFGGDGSCCSEIWDTRRLIWRSDHCTRGPCIVTRWRDCWYLICILHNKTQGQLSSRLTPVTPISDEQVQPLSAVSLSAKNSNYS